MSSHPRPRHVVWITTDHMRYDCVGANGNPAVRTPALDRLAGGGVSLDHCYGQNPLCMPSRVSFMTGQYPCRTGVTCNGPALPPERGPACAQVFGAGGYATAQVGKLHFEPHDEMDLDPATRRRYGFDYMALSEEPGCYEDAYIRWLRAVHPEYADVMRVPRPRERMRSNGPFITWTVDAPAEVSHAGFAVDQAIHVLRGGRPCFVHVGIYAPHPPLNPPREIYDAYEGVELPQPHWQEGEAEGKPEPLRSMLRGREDLSPEQWRERRRFFYAMCTLLDGQVGRLVEELEARGELDQTLILFMSDHGDMDGDHRMVSKQPSFYREVMHLPVILHWPDGLPAGGRVAGLTEAVDLLPTLCGLSGVHAPDTFQGRDLTDALRGEVQEELREDALAMHAAPGAPLWANLRTPELSYIRYGPEAEVLYDLAEDPGEHVNHAAEQAYAERLNQMRQRLLDRMLSAASSALSRVRPF
ncbi:MAG: sulfatase-like hydrolase/transferase [Candidatus Brocadiia bacterium]